MEKFKNTKKINVSTDIYLDFHRFVYNYITLY